MKKFLSFLCALTMMISVSAAPVVQAHNLPKNPKALQIRPADAARPGNSITTIKATNVDGKIQKAPAQKEAIQQQKTQNKLASTKIQQSQRARKAVAEVPSDYVLADYYTEGQVCVCIFVPADMACNDIVFTGTYNGWSSTPEDCAVFQPIPDYDGWYVVAVNDDSTPDPNKGLQGKPIMLDADGRFNWDYQIGAATVIRGGVEVLPGYTNEIDLVNYGTDAPNVFTVDAWKKNPCDAIYHNYTITVINDGCDGRVYPYMVGTPTNWAFEGMIYNEVLSDENSAPTYTYSFKAAEGTAYQIVSGYEDPITGAIIDPTWTDEAYLQELNEEGEWVRIRGEEGDNLITHEEASIVYDLRAENLRWARCNGEELENVSVRLIAPVDAPAAGIEIIGSFDDWTGTAMEFIDGGWEATIQAKGSMIFKFREAGNWENEIMTYDEENDTWIILPEFQFNTVWNGLEGNRTIVLDLSDPDQFAWRANREPAEEDPYEGDAEIGFDMAFPNGVEYYDHFIENNLHYHIIQSSTEDKWLGLYFITETAEITPGLYPINYSWEAGTVLASQSTGHYSIITSLNEYGNLVAPYWCMVSGTVTVTEDGYAIIDAVNSKGYYIYASVLLNIPQQPIAETTLWEGPVELDWNADLISISNEQMANVPVGSTISIYYEVPEAEYHTIRVTTPWWGETDDDDLVPQIDGMEYRQSPLRFTYDEHCKALVEERGAMCVVGFGLMINKITYAYDYDFVPTEADLAQWFDVQNNIVLAMKFDGQVCNDIVFVGNHALREDGSWVDDPDLLPHFRALPNFEGWYGVEVPFHDGAQGKPVQLLDDGTFDWNYQAGGPNAWYYRGGNEAAIYYDAYYDAEVNYPAPGAYIYELAYWKENACGRHQVNYTINVIAPTECTEMIPAIIGDFNNWTENIPMTPVMMDTTLVYTVSFVGTPGDEYKFREASDTEWENQMIFWFDGDEDFDAGWYYVQFALPEEASEGDGVTLWFDFSDYSLVRFEQCVEEEPDYDATEEDFIAEFNSFDIDDRYVADYGVLFAYAVNENNQYISLELVLPEGATTLVPGVYPILAEGNDQFAFTGEIYEGDIYGSFACNVSEDGYIMVPLWLMNEGQIIINEDLSITVDAVNTHGRVVRASLVNPNIPIETQQCGDNLTWSMDENGVLTIEGYGEMWDNMYETWDCSAITAVILPEGITSIGRFAFYNTQQLTSIELPSSLEEIRDYAFFNSGLQSLHIPANIWALYDNAFGYCRYLNVLTAETNYNLMWSSAAFEGTSNVQFFQGPAWYLQVLKSSALVELRITEGAIREAYVENLYLSHKTLRIADLSGYQNNFLPEEIFHNFYNLEEVILPECLNFISNSAFADCKSLRTIDIPAAVYDIENSAFYNCHSLSAVNFAEGSVLRSVGKWAFYNCHNLPSIVLPEGVIEIGDGAFYGCVYAENMVLPASVVTIGDNAFALCTRLNKMEVNAVLPPAIVDKTFFEVSREAPVYVPDESVDIYKQDRLWNELNIVGRSQMPHGIDNVNAGEKVQKVLRDGQLLLIRGERTFTTTGVEVK